MLAILYLALAIFLGDRLRRLLLPPAHTLYASLSTRGIADLPAWLFDVPAAVLLGLTPAIWLTYFVAWLVAAVPGLRSLANPLLPTQIITMPMLFIFSLATTNRLQERAAHRQLRAHPRDEAPAAGARSRDRVLRQSLVYFSVLAAFMLFGLWLMRSSFYLDGDQLHAGYSVFSDFAPHTALVSSFARGANFPTQYPHFPLDGIRYHFLFYFLCGNLNFLGLPIDWAINLPSLIGLGSFVSLLGLLAVLITGRRLAFFAAPALMFLRSSFAIFSFIRGRRGGGASVIEAIRAIGQSPVFIGNTRHEDWGLFAVNVYANQRHLLFGAALLLLLLFLMLPLLRKGLRARHPDAGRHHPLLEPDAWLPPDGGVLAAVLLITAALPYLHGSVLIVFLLILAVLAIFSAGRLVHLLTALVGIGAAILQTRWFAGGTDLLSSFAWHFGFLADKPTLWRVFAYCVELYGMAFLLMLVLPWVQPGRFRTVLAAAFWVPFAFAFMVSLTPDVTVNHKYLMLSVALANMLIVDLVARVWEKPHRNHRARRVDLGDAPPSGPSAWWQFADLRQRWENTQISHFLQQNQEALRRVWIGVRRAAAVLLATMLIATGVADIWVFARVNRQTVTMDLSSPVIAWIDENTRPDEIFLTDTYAYNDFFYSGRMTYFGHAYYAWSAGHDTAKREALYRQLLGGCDGDYNAFRLLCSEQRISYLLVDDALRQNRDSGYQDRFFAANFPVLARFPAKNNATIYDLR